MWNLQHSESSEAELFRRFSALGHYKKRKQDATRQGIYAVTPSGQFLGSWNTRYVPNVVGHLERVLAKWNALAPEEKKGGVSTERDRRLESLYPEAGLSLVVYSRDLPREVHGKEEQLEPEEDTDAALLKTWRSRAWNQDRFWLRESEVAPLLKGKPLQDKVLRRLVHMHGRDNVRGQTPAYSQEHILAATMEFEWLEQTDERVEFRMAGEGKVSETGEWPIHDGRDAAAEQTRAFGGNLRGHGLWEKGEWKHFTLVWTGLRRGATQYNGRHDDPGPQPMAVVFVLAPKADRIAPSLIWRYGWK